MKDNIVNIWKGAEGNIILCESFWCVCNAYICKASVFIEA